jgi:hypothetical protein
MYLLRKRTVESLRQVFRPNRKNLAVHVSLSSNLHNVKERTPGAALAGGVSGSKSFRILQNRNHPRLPGSSSALSGALISGSETRSASSTWRVVFKTFTSVNNLFAASVRALGGRRLPPQRGQSLVPSFGPVYGIRTPSGSVDKPPWSGVIASPTERRIPWPFRLQEREAALWICCPGSRPDAIISRKLRACGVADHPSRAAPSASPSRNEGSSRRRARLGPRLVVRDRHHPYLADTTTAHELIVGTGERLVSARLPGWPPATPARLTTCR